MLNTSMIARIFQFGKPSGKSFSGIPRDFQNGLRCLTDKLTQTIWGQTANKKANTQNPNTKNAHPTPQTPPPQNKKKKEIKKKKKPQTQKSVAFHTLPFCLWHSVAL
mgnify:CR=1 FL=1